MVTMYLSADNLDLFETDHWLSDPKDVMVVKLTERAWMDGAPSAAAAPMSPKDTFHHWTLAELARFMRAKDLAGPSAILQANGVTGADLLDMSASDLEGELRLTPFAARKVIKARDAFLSAP